MARVLLVEDNPMNRELETILLEMAGHSVICAESGDEALRELRNEIPDIILLDLALPGKSGLAIAQEIRALPNGRGVVMVAVSANCSKDDVRAAEAVGCAGMIPKPINARMFAAEVAAYLPSGS